MRKIIVSIVKKQASGRKWLICEEIVDNVRVYIYWYGNEVDGVLKMELEQIVEDKDGLWDATQTRINLEEAHMKMRENVKNKLAKYLELLLEVPSADKYQWWFDLMPNPRYVDEFTDVIKLHEIETVDTSTIIN